jgi:hypothetical protein
LADARKELLDIQQEFVHLQKRIDAVRDCVTVSLTSIFGDERPAIAALAEEELIEGIARPTGEAALDHPSRKQCIQHVRVF